MSRFQFQEANKYEHISDIILALIPDGAAVGVSHKFPYDTHLCGQTSTFITFVTFIDEISCVCGGGRAGIVIKRERQRETYFHIRTG
jgi:hypothetical protein